MATYIYACSDPTHPREEVIHGMTEIVEVRCSVCKHKMHRVPQLFRWGRAGIDIIIDRLEERQRRSRRGAYARS